MTKALTDRGCADSFPDAEARLNSVHVLILVGDDQACTAAGQAAALTATATAYKCFGRVALIATDRKLLFPLPIGPTLHAAAGLLGARIAANVPKDITHIVEIGDTIRVPGWRLRCWWDRWLSGTRVFNDEPLGDSRLPLAGVFAAAIAIRQIFAGVVAGYIMPARETVLSLWEPWNDDAPSGPEHFDLPNALWLLGLGHLGQAFIRNLSLLPYQGQRSTVLQDDQTVGEENEATGILVTPADIGERKTRVARHWLEACGWRTALIERRHYGDICFLPDDPPFLLCGLDRLEPRIAMAKVGFDCMIDAGVGHGPVDFEALQIRVIPKNQSIDGFWSTPDGTKRIDRLLATKPYEAMEQSVGQCGTYTLAEASVSVPFVGAATGAIAIAQLIRLASLKPSPQLLQLELGAPGMVTLSALTQRPKMNLGSEHCVLMGDASTSADHRHTETSVTLHT